MMDANKGVHQAGYASLSELRQSVASNTNLLNADTDFGEN